MKTCVVLLLLGWPIYALVLPFVGLADVFVARGEADWGHVRRYLTVGAVRRGSPGM